LQQEDIAGLATKSSADANPALVRTPEALPHRPAAVAPVSMPVEAAASSVERIITGAELTSARPIASVAASIPATAPGNVYLQLGAFSARDNADGFRARVYREVAWLNDQIEIVQRDGLFRLHLGPYANREQAAGMADRLKRDIELRPVYVTR